MGIETRIFFSVLLFVFLSAFITTFEFSPLYYGHTLRNPLDYFQNLTHHWEGGTPSEYVNSLLTFFLFLFSLAVASVSVIAYRIFKWLAPTRRPLQNMRKILLIIGSILTVTGVIAVSLSGFETPGNPLYPIPQWDLVATRAGVASFSIYLMPGQYKISAWGYSSAFTNPVFLDIEDADGNLIHRINTQSTAKIFTATKADNYYLYLRNYLTPPGTDNIQIEIHKESTQYHTALARTRILLVIGGPTLLTGTGALITGLNSPRTKKQASTP